MLTETTVNKLNEMKLTTMARAFNVFRTEDSFMVSDVMEEKEYFGRTIMVINQYE